MSYIVNLSLSLGIFPNSLKIAKIIPIYKKDDPTQITNYRPISLLPSVSKILERIFNNRLDNFVENQNILTNSQYGFRTGRSTSMSILDLLE